MHFTLFTQPMHARLLIRFFKRLIASRDRKVFVIIDNLPVYRSHVVRDNADAIKLFQLPSWSPHPDSDEYLNNDFQGRVYRHPPAGSPRVLHQQILSALRSIQRRVEQVRRYFRHPKVQYVA